MMRRTSGLFLICVCLLATGCGESSFLGRRFDNFKAHYNKYYNAKRAYEKGVRDRERQDRAVDQERYVSIFLDNEQGGAGGDFQRAIEKGAEILRKHPRSKWVDNALMLIGKSYFYQQGYVGAEQKFREVIDLGSPLADEAEFWLARTLVAARALDAAEEVIDDMLSEAEEDRLNRWEAALYLVNGELYVQRRDWIAAAAALERGLEDVRDDRLAARAQFLLGQVYETLEEYEQAAEAYARVHRHRPLYELSYAALVSEVRMRGLHGDPDRALAMLRRMKRDDKHFSYLNALELLEAQVLKAAGRYDAAFAIYDELLYDEQTNVGALRGRVHHGMAELYRDGYVDYFKAAAHFDTAASAIRAPRTSQELMTPYAIVDARETADVFGQFRTIAERIIRADSLLALGALDSAAFDAAVDEIRLKRAQDARRRRAELERRMAENRFRGAAAGNTGRNPAAGRVVGGNVGGDYGFLNYKDAARAQEGFELFRETWGERPRVDNWRRREAITEVLAQRSREGGEEAEELTAFQGGMFIPPVDVSEVPRDSASRAEMVADLAAAQYELANVLFLSMHMPDSAASWYRLVIEEDDTREVARRAYFALAEVQLALGDSVAARRIYREIVANYPATDFALRSRERLGLPSLEKAPDSLSLARRRYDEAYALWTDGRHREATHAMLRTAADFPTTSIAPKALVAAGLIHTQWAQRNGYGLDEPILVPDSLLPPPPDSLRARWETVRALLAPHDSTAASTTASTAESAVEGARDSVETLAVTSIDSVRAEHSMESSAEPVAEPAAHPPADTLALPADPIFDMPVDTLADAGAFDGAPPDTAQPEGEPMTAAAGADTTAIEVAGADTTAAGPDLTEPVYFAAGIIPMPLRLETLYASVERNFARTPFADRARSLQTYLAELRAARAAADSLAAMPDSVRTAPDSVQTPVAAAGAETTGGADGAVFEAGADSVRPADVLPGQPVGPEAAPADGPAGPADRGGDRGADRGADREADRDAAEAAEMDALRSRRDALLRRRQAEADSVRAGDVRRRGSEPS